METTVPSSVNYGLLATLLGLTVAILGALTLRLPEVWRFVYIAVILLLMLTAGVCLGLALQQTQAPNHDH